MCLYVKTVFSLPCVCFFLKKKIKKNTPKTEEKKRKKIIDITQEK